MDLGKKPCGDSDTGFQNEKASGRTNRSRCFWTFNGWTDERNRRNTGLHVVTFQLCSRREALGRCRGPFRREISSIHQECRHYYFSAEMLKS